MDRPVFHLPHPRWTGHSLCGLRLAADEHLITVAVLSPLNAIEAMGADGMHPTCRACLVGLFASALARHGVVLVDGRREDFLASHHLDLWTGQAIRQRREAAGLTRTDVARLTGLADSTVRNIESGSHYVTARVRGHLMTIPQLAPKPLT